MDAKTKNRKLLVAELAKLNKRLKDSNLAEFMASLGASMVKAAKRVRKMAPKKGKWSR